MISSVFTSMSIVSFGILVYSSFGDNNRLWYGSILGLIVFAVLAWVFRPNVRVRKEVRKRREVVG